ncbi:MAG: hypothetical protein ACOYY2_03020 [Actinomycetota bacterium]
MNNETARDTAREALERAERLLACECGHGLGEHNGLGCYARLSYQPLVTCPCELTDDRTYAELLAPRLDAIVAERVAALAEDARFTAPTEEGDRAPRTGDMHPTETAGWSLPAALNRECEESGGTGLSGEDSP